MAETTHVPDAEEGPLGITVAYLPRDAPPDQRKVLAYAFYKDEVLLGRGEGTDVRLPHREVSLVHARVLCRGGRVELSDAGSTNGTWLADQRLRPGRPRPVSPDQEVRIGPFSLRLGDARAARDAPRDTSSFARTLAAQVLDDEQAGAVLPHLEVQNGPQRGTRLSLPPDGSTRVIGRASEADFCLEDADASRQHLVVQAGPEGVRVRDLESKNGLFLDGERITQWQPLVHGAELRVGRTTLRLVDPAVAFLGELLLGEGELGRQTLPRGEAVPAEPGPGHESGPAHRSAPRRTSRGDLALIALVGALALGAAATLALLFFVG